MPEINQQPTPAGRQPRGAVLVNGVSVPFIHFEVDSNNSFEADTFAVDFPALALPPSLSASSLMDGQDLTVEVRAGFPLDPASWSPTDLDSLIVGRVDDVSFDPLTGVFSLHGRDLTGLFIDRKTTEKWQNMTASQIATMLATRVGLKPVVTPTTTKAGTYYTVDHARMTIEMSEWALLCYLAAQEGFTVYVKGRELHFEPKPDTSSTDSPYLLQWNAGASGPASFNGMSLQLKRNLTVARNVTVVVRSFQPKTKKVIVASYPNPHASKGARPGTSGANQPESHVRTIPNLTKEQALQRAEAIHREITTHEMSIVADLPGDSLLTPFVMVALRGTGTPFDQFYYPENVKRTMDRDEGYRMSLTAKNRAPENDPTL